MIVTKRAAEFKEVIHVTHLIASSSAVALQSPLSLSFGCVRSQSELEHLSSTRPFKSQYFHRYQ